MTALAAAPLATSLAVPGPGGKPSLLLAGLAEGLRAWMRYRRLRAMSDCEFGHLGLARADIARYALLGDETRSASW